MPNRTIPGLLLIFACSPDDTGDTGGDLPPPIAEYLAEDCGDYTPGSGVAPGDDLHKVTLDAPDAVCNDGTPGVMYVRPSTGGDNADKWVIYLQGGHACSDFEGCVVRYCGTEKYTKAKMSSNWTPVVANSDGQGILDRDGVNPAGDMNAVLLYYCSSDQWWGQHTDAVLTNPDDPDDQYRLQFHGHDIVDAALAALEDGATSDDGVVTMPSLTEASLLVWSGASAGAGGAEQHADWVSDRFSPNGTRVVALFDANLPPRVEDLPEGAEAFDAAARDVRWPEVHQALYASFLDASCLAMHPPDEQWRCGQNTHVVLEHVTTPYFVRQDLRDSVIGAPYLDQGVPMPVLSAGYRSALLDLPNVPDDAEEAEAISVTPGAYGPNCGQHVALTDHDFFRVATVDDATAGALTFGGAFLRWIGGEPVLAIDTVPATTSECPSTNGAAE